MYYSLNQLKTNLKLIMEADDEEKEIIKQEYLVDHFPTTRPSESKGALIPSRNFST